MIIFAVFMILFFVASMAIIAVLTAQEDSYYRRVDRELDRQEIERYRHWLLHHRHRGCSVPGCLNAAQPDRDECRRHA